MVPVQVSKNWDWFSEPEQEVLHKSKELCNTVPYLLGSFKYSICKM